MSHWQHCGQDCQTYHLNIVTVNLSIHKILLLDFCSPATVCKVPGRCQFYQPYENDYKDDCDDVLSYDDDVADNDDDDVCCLVFKPQHCSEQALVQLRALCCSFLPAIFCHFFLLLRLDKSSIVKKKTSLWRSCARCSRSIKSLMRHMY